MSLHSQWVSIPDTNFGTWLNTYGYSACMQGNNGVGWQMDTSCPAVVGATEVDCSSKNIIDLTGISYFDNLDTLDCSSNQLSSLPALPRSLIVLICADNQLSTLPALPGSLTYLDCYYNQFSTLPALPGGLIALSCGANPLSSLPSLPGSLTHLYCVNNQLSFLPTLPGGLTTLRCDRNQLSSLPALPGNLTSLECKVNQLSSLPALSGSLSYLDCSFNLLSTLPALPGSLTNLYCDYNQLTFLPTLPGSLTWLNCMYNQLSFIPELPDFMLFLNCSYNPNLVCLPELKEINTFYFNNTGITCLPNYSKNISWSDPPLDSVLLCDVFNTHGCPVYSNVSGKVYHDVNNNCTHDTAETKMGNIKVQFWSDRNLLEQAVTINNGTYSVDADMLGIYSVRIDTTALPFAVICPANNLITDTLTLLDSLKYGNDFGLACKPGFDLAAWSVEGRFRPGDTRKVDIHVGSSSSFYGVNCAGGITGSVTIVITGPATYISPTPGALTPDNVSGNTLTYNVADFGNIDFNNSFNIRVQTDTTAALGLQVCFTVTVTATNIDAVPTNNTLTHCFPVVGSFDPNDKQVYPSADIDTAQEWLTYTVRFQNTGTAEAQHIYITDTLDSDVDVSSFQLLAYSHQPMVQLKENAVRFNFPNINLPDSNTSEPLSHGYVQYKIKLKDNLPIGTAINNTAFIYFDFNAPVVTNTTTNTIAVVSGLTDNRQQTTDIRLFPNPASDAVTISIDESMVGATATVTDVTGRRVAMLNIEHRISNIEVGELANGVYFVTVTDKEGRSIAKKLVINK